MTTHPNIIFVLTDDLSWNLVKYMPHVRALERTGTTFDDYFVTDSLCCPSRASIFTGEYPHNDGVRLNGGYSHYSINGGYRAYNKHNDAAKTFAVALQRTGYRTAMMGKFLNRYQPQYPVSPGWNEWDVTGNGYPEYHYTLNENGTEHPHGGAPRDYLTDVLSNRAASFVRRMATAGTAYQLEVAPFTPHVPSTPAPRDLKSFPQLRAPRTAAYDRLPTRAPPWLAAIPKLTPLDEIGIDHAFRKRVQSVQSVDRMIGRLEQTVRATGQADNTYFVFSSDNGYHMGEYHLRPGKETAFDTDIRVPLIISGPGVLPGRHVSALASSIDLAPTFASIAGAPVAASVDGTSLLPLLHGVTPRNWQSAVFVEHVRGPAAASDPDKPSLYGGDPPTYTAIRTATALYVSYADGEREYYDLARDPDELHNLAAVEPSSTIAPLERAVRAVSRCHGAAACLGAAQVSTRR